MEFKPKSKRQLNRILKKKVENVIKVCEIESKVLTIQNNNDFSLPSTSYDVTNSSNQSNLLTTSDYSDRDSSGYGASKSHILLHEKDLEVDKCEHSVDKSRAKSDEGESESDIADVNELLSSDSDDPENSSTNTNDFLNNIHSGPNKNPKKFLASWALENNISHKAFSQLLGWFSTGPDISNLPRDARTILKTPRECSIKTMSDGLYTYCGIKSGLKKQFVKYGFTECMLIFNIDGLPIQKSSKKTFWPILCRIHSLPLDSLFCVVIYYGPGKPPVQEYLEEFVRELNTYLTEGLVFKEGVIVKVKVLAFCCDTPARAYIKCTIGHNHYSGCDKCCVRGVYVDRRMTFVDRRATLRTDESFSSQQFREHHKYITPLANVLNLGLVTSFPGDYMHAVCLGVMKKLILQWRDGSRQYRITKEKNILLNIRISDISNNYWPVDFNRKPRSISELEYWKAKEYRQFLLYIAPVILHDILPNNVYCNFLLLKFGVMILLNSSLNKDYNSYANDLLHLFVRNGTEIYGDTFCIYNVHSLIHLADDAKRFGSLEDINCFPFENYLYQLKRMLRKSNEPLQQVIHRLAERDCILEEIKNFKDIYFEGKPTAEGNKTVYPRLKFKGFTISTKLADSCIYIQNGIIRVTKIYTINNEMFLTGTEYQNVGSFLEYPTDTSTFSIFILRPSKKEINIPVNNILYKGLILPFKNNYVCYPLLHLFS